MKTRNWYRDVFKVAADIVGGNHYETVVVNGRENFVHSGLGRDWFRRETRRYELHPAVVELLEANNKPMPRDWQQLLLEWPHRSETDHNRVAYTPDEAKGIADRQTVTTLGKYLTRHFDLPDHVIRDIVARHTAVGECKHYNTMQDILRGVLKGPTSCMSKDFDIECKDGELRHPYQVYRPEFGWGIALREHLGIVEGRALTWTDPKNDKRKIFVRSYKRCPNGGYSYADEMLEAWLKAEGFEKECGWNRWSKIAAYLCEDGQEYLAPYVDGDVQNADLNHGADAFVFDESGEFSMCNTSGVTERAGETCGDCGRRVHEDDLHYVGYNEDTAVCESCLHDNYTHVYGRRGNEYYVLDDDAIEVDGCWYDVNYLTDNDIVQLHDGDYAHLDSAVHIDSCNEWYLHDDDDVCFAEDIGQYELTLHCWHCEGSDKWYTDAIDYVNVDGEMYHPDHAPAPTENNQGE